MNILRSTFIFCIGLLTGVVIWENYDLPKVKIEVVKSDLEKIIDNIKNDSENKIFKVNLKVLNNKINDKNFELTYNLEKKSNKSKVVRLLEIFYSSKIEIKETGDKENIKDSALTFLITTTNKIYESQINEIDLKDNISIQNFLKLFQVYTTKR